MKALIVGSTGMVGSEVLKACLLRPELTKITVVNRDPEPTRDERLNSIVHTDFANFATIKRKLSGHDIVFYCVGVYQGAVPPEVFAHITLDFLAALARTVESEKTTFCLLSAGGAKASSSVLFAKWKGRAEEELLTHRFKTIYVFRPGYIHPTDPARRPKLLRYRLFSFLHPLILLLGPWASITSRQLAQAMVTVSVQGNERHIFENAAIRRIT